MKPEGILIIGGGIAGVTAAWLLARAGGDVTLIDRHDLMTLASGSNAGSLHLQIPPSEFRLLGEDWAKRFAPVIPMMREGVAMWSGLGDELGADLELSTHGGLTVAANSEDMDLLVRKATIERRFGLDVRLLARDEILNIAPYLGAHVQGGLMCAGEGKVNPLIAGPALVRAAGKAGVRLLRRVELKGLQRDGDGFLARTTAGDLHAGRVINCAGADAGRVAAMLGLDFAIEAVPIQVNVTTPMAPLIPHLVYSAAGKLSLKQTRMGAFIIGGGWAATRDAQGRPAVSPASVAGNLAMAMGVVPQLAGVQLLRTWPCVVNGTADWRPILGETPRVKGFHMCMFPWSGFTAGPFAARLVTDNLMGKAPPAACRELFLQ